MDSIGVRSDERWSSKGSHIERLTWNLGTIRTLSLEDSIGSLKSDSCTIGLSIGIEGGGLDANA